MENGNKKLYIIGGVVLFLVLSCCCVGGGVAFFMTRGEEERFAETPAAPPGWSTYTQTIDCVPYNPGLTLTGFSVAYPPTHRVELCTDQQPSAYNYATLYTLDGAGNMTGQFGIGYMTGVPMASLIDQLVENMRTQMPAGTTFTMRTDTTLAARGTSLTRKDYVLNLTGQLGLMAAGQYAFRVVLVPDESSVGQGVTLIIIERADLGTEAAFAELDGDYLRMIESLRF
jgi:hypothetical protein